MVVIVIVVVVVVVVAAACDCYKPFDDMLGNEKIRNISVMICNFVGYSDVFYLFPDGQGGANPLSPTRGHEEEEEEDDDEFGGGDTLMSAARTAAKAETEFSQQDTLVIREEVRGGQNCGPLLPHSPSPSC